MLIKNQAYLKFLNILIVQYADFMFKVMNCYDTRAD